MRCQKLCQQLNNPPFDLIYEQWSRASSSSYITFFEVKDTQITLLVCEWTILPRFTVTCTFLSLAQLSLLEPCHYHVPQKDSYCICQLFAFCKDLLLSVLYFDLILSLSLNHQKMALHHHIQASRSDRFYRRRELFQLTCSVQDDEDSFCEPILR